MIICPFLKERVPAEVWQRYRTIIIHPGPPGDRGPSSLDWAISAARAELGRHRAAGRRGDGRGPDLGLPDLPDARRRRRARAASTTARSPRPRSSWCTRWWPRPPTRSFRPRELVLRRPGRARPAASADAPGRPRVLLVRPDGRHRAPDPRRGRLARCTHHDRRGRGLGLRRPSRPARSPGEPGTVLQRSRGAVLVRTGDGSVWIGHAKLRDREQPKLPTNLALGRPARQRARGRRSTRLPGDQLLPDRPVGVLTFDFYNGAMSTGQCERLAAALRHATTQDTRVLVVRGGEVFSNGIHLNVIEAAPDPEHRGVAQHQGHRRRLPRDHLLHPVSWSSPRSPATPAPAA